MSQITFITLYWILVAVFSGFSLFMVGRYRMLPSYSESYYTLLERQKDKKALSPFQGFLFVVGLLTAIIGNNPWYGLSGFSLWLVAGAPNFKDKAAQVMHSGGALAAIILSHAGMIFAQHLYILTSISVLGMVAILLFNKKVANHTTKIEFIGFIAGFIALAIKVYSL